MRKIFGGAAIVGVARAGRACHGRGVGFRPHRNLISIGGHAGCVTRQGRDGAVNDRDCRFTSARRRDGGSAPYYGDGMRSAAKLGIDLAKLGLDDSHGIQKEPDSTMKSTMKSALNPTDERIVAKILENNFVTIPGNVICTRQWGQSLACSARNHFGWRVHEDRVHAA